MKKWILLFTMMFLMNETHAQLPVPSAGRIVRIPDFQSRFVQPRNIDVWLPEGYSNTEKYAVIYMHDGQMLYDSTLTGNKQEWQVDEVFSALIDEQEIQACIVVGIWNNAEYRHAEYFPEKPLASLDENLRDSIVATWLKGKPLADNYLKFIIHELKPCIDQKFATLPDLDHTFIAGSSMGGLISMYAICEYPDIFKGAACLSTHWPGTFEQNDFIPQAFNWYLTENLPDPASHQFYFDYGTETLDSLYEKHQLVIDKTMILKGYDHTNRITLKFPGEDHPERSWAKRLHTPFIFLLK
ncbi:alpha/beta hydrolase [Gaoshiqia sediminis]|uniref:Esterase family protein n=1 Tax=Gaoshiqia sediminis TaxID=2986998 RepID=A0AA42C7F0_9BACT|nr:alpha/beta hydrolase-fold protein [Gaoshiqia sediminis]MCW0481516.1 esterase family protein [Gaoshiqia sediminis]